MSDQPQAIQIGPEQVVKAATAGLALLNTPGAVNVPGPMAVSGEIQLLNALLTALVQGTVVLGHPQKAPPPANDNDDLVED